MPGESFELPSLPHLTGIEGMNRPQIEGLLVRAEHHLIARRERAAIEPTLSGHLVANLFFEPSTRTRMSFEIATRSLGGAVVNGAAGPTSSSSKGETLLDSSLTVDAMGPDIVIVRHSASGAAHYLSQNLNASIVNAGDGAHEHPTQALLDALTLRRKLKTLEGKIVVIVGDLLHSRVARSDIIALQLLGAEVRVLAPTALTPPCASAWGAKTFTVRSEAFEGAHVVMALRMQRERMAGGDAPDPDEFASHYGVTREALRPCSPSVVVAHPGPMNRGYEIDGDVADDGALCVVLEQVEAGVAVRMAVLEALAQARSVR